MRKYNWIIFTSFRYLRARKTNRMLGPSFLAVGGIAIGVMALVSVLGVMNGFQFGFIEDIMNINSFHIRVNSSNSEIDDDTLKILQNTEGISSVLPFIDIQTLIKGEYSDFEAVNIRFVPGNIENYDSSMAKQLNLIEGEFEFQNENSLILGVQLAARLGVGIDDNIFLVTMEGSNFRNISPSDRSFKISGLFQSGYYNFDRSMGFSIFSNSKLLSTGKEKIIYGVKLKDKYNDKIAVTLIKEKLGENYTVQSWRDFNSSFFGALRTEKTAMMLVIGLIFIVVGVNIKHSLERSVMEKREEIGVLMSLGASSSSIRTIFVIEGFIIGISGAVIGLVIGFLVTSNINSIFRGMEVFTGFIETLVKVIVSPFTNVNYGISSVFSVNNFYISEIPVKIVFSEIFYVFIFAILASTWAAYSASKIVSRYKPAEVLRYE